MRSASAIASSAPIRWASGSAFAFGLPGTLAKSLMVAGWSPTAAVAARLAGGALALSVVATIVRPDWVREARAHARTVVLYGLIPVAGAQLDYHNAVSHLSVGVALLLGVISTAIAYTLGISGVGRLRPSFASLVGLAEVLVAVLALARQGDRGPEVRAANWPDTGPLEAVASGGTPLGSR